MAVAVDLSKAICKPGHGGDTMRMLIGISALAILFGIASAPAEERTTDNPVAQKSVRNFTTERHKERLRRLGFHPPRGGTTRGRHAHLREPRHRGE